MNTNKIKEKMKLAKELATQEDDEKYKIAAYEVILSKLLDEDIHVSTKDGRMQKNAVKGMHDDALSSKNDDEFEKIIDGIDVDKLSYVKELESMLDKCLALLNYINDTWPHNEGLLIDQIRNIFVDKLGLTTTSNDAIRMALVRSTGKYVTRKKIIGTNKETYKYKILTAGKEYVKTVKTE